MKEKSFLAPLTETRFRAKTATTKQKYYGEKRIWEIYGETITKLRYAY